MKLSEEQAKKEGEYAQRQFVIDTDKAALKTKISGVTGDQLRAFIALDAEQQKAALNSSDSLKMMWDLLGGSDKFKPLEESYAKVVEADTKFFESNKRTQSQLSTLTNELAKEKEEKIKKDLEDKLNGLEVENKKQLQLINQLHIDGIDSEETYQQKLINEEKRTLEAKRALYKIGSKEYEDFTVQLQNITIKSVDDRIKEESKALKAGNDLLKEALKEDEDATKESQDSQLKEADKFWEERKKLQEKRDEEEIQKKKKIQDVQFQMASDLANGIFDMGSTKRDQELSALDAEKEKKLSNKKLTEAQKAKIEEEYDKKAAAIKTKQAKADKLQALFNIALSTGEGAMKAVAQFPITGGMPFLAWVLAAGALQSAMVAAQPIPKFAKGTSSAPDKGIFGEAGLELMKLRTGEIQLADKPTYFEGSKFKGARIYSNPETEKLMRLENSVGGRQMTDERLLSALNKIDKSIKSKPVAIYDNNHRQIGIGTSNSQTVYLNRLIRN
jgi:hypothetical protein